MIAPNGGHLQSLYANWIGELLGGVIPHESRATCNDCAMCAQKGEDSQGVESIFFDPEVKCCSYLPELPNFLVGRILLDSRDDPLTNIGRATVVKRIADKAGVTPLGLMQSPVYSLLYQNSFPMFG